MLRWLVFERKKEYTGEYFFLFSFLLHFILSRGMKTFIVIILASIALIFLTVSNTTLVPLHFFHLTVNVPLPFVLSFPTGIALLCFALYHMRQMHKATLVIRELEDDLQHEQEKVLEIVRRTHALEIENRKLKIRLGDTDFDDDSL